MLYLGLLNNQSLSFKIFLYKFHSFMNRHNYFVKMLIKINNFINSLLERNLNKLNAANLKKILINNKIFLTILLLVILFLSYLSIPNIYNQNQISEEIKKNLVEKLNLEFNFEKKFDYKFFPRPHFITNESSLIFNEKKISEISKIKINFDISSAHPAMKAINYKQGLDVIEGKIEKSELFEKSLFATRQFAKRQCTWMRGWENLISFDLHQRDEATEELKKQLNLL